MVSVGCDINLGLTFTNGKCRDGTGDLTVLAKNDKAKTLGNKPCD